jgi:hypothetical protein
MMRKILLLSAFAAASLGVAQAQTVGGRYEVIGANADGSTYRGEAQIVVTPQNTCRISWSAAVVSEGICMRYANNFTAAYALKGKIALAMYHVMQDGSMQGLWTVADSQGVGRETLVPVR